MRGPVRIFALNLLGSFRLSRPDGERIEITSMKGMALIAMLAMANDGERTRTWLQDRLWGSRQRPQAQSSLRRELSILRKCLNQLPEPVLICEHHWIKLDLRYFDVDARASNAGDAPSIRRGRETGGEFLEGFDIAGEDGFEEWLREQRSVLEDRGTRRSEAATVAAAPPQTSPTGIAAISGPARSASAEPAELPVAAVDHPPIEGGATPATSFLLDVPTAPDMPRTAVPPAAAIVHGSRPAPSFGDRPALAILPFANRTDDPAYDYLSEGLSEDLIDRLSRLRWLPVIARNSSFALAGDTVDPRVVGQSLGAKYVLEGRLRPSGDGLSIAVSLSDAGSGYTLWSQRLPLPPRQSQDALDPLVAELVGVLDARIDYAEQTRARGKRQNRLEFNDLIWRGRWHLNRLSRTDSETARSLFAQALELEPNSPEALIQATFCLGWTIWARRGSEAQTVEMRRLAQRAIVADPDDGRGHMLAGIAEMWLRQPLRARTLLERAIALNPSLAQAHAQLGCHYNLIGEPATAIGPLKMAVRLSPNDIHIFFMLGELAMAHGMLGQWAEAVDYAEQSLIRRPAYWYAHVVKVNALARSGDVPAAIFAFDELLTMTPDFSTRHLDWIPFVDPSRRQYLIDGLAMAASKRPAWLEENASGARICVRE